MKTQTLSVVSLAFFLLFMPALGIAEEMPRSAENEISIDLAMPIICNLADPYGISIPIYLDYQRVLTDHFVLSIAPGFVYLPALRGSSSLLSLWLELDWHPFQTGLTGFFLGPAVAAILKTDYDKNGAASASIFGAMAGLSIGYQFMLPANFDIDIVMGVAFGTVQGYGTTQGLPRAALALGYRF